MRATPPDDAAYHTFVAPQATQKLLARWLVKTALRSGRLVRMPCEECGVEPADAHHDDYDKPLDVRWLCRKHHRAEHRPTECKHGHAYTPDNTRVRGNAIECRSCQRVWSKRYKTKEAA